MERAMRDAGYFYAANMPGLDVEYMQNVYTLSTAAHALPLDVKRQFVHPHGTYSGQYRRLHPERVDCQVTSIRLRRRRGRGTRRARVRERHHLGGSRVGLLTHALHRQGALPQQPAPDHRCYGLRHTRRAQRFVWESKRLFRRSCGGRWFRPTCSRKSSTRCTSDRTTLLCATPHPPA